MNKNIIIGVIAVAVIALGAAMFFKSSPSSQITANPTPTAAQMEQDDSMAPTEAMTTGEPEDAMMQDVKEVTVTGSAFKFDPKEITVKKGQKIKIVFKNAGGMHDFVIDELDVKTKVLESGQSETVEFTADKAGEYEYYCSVANHRQMGMVGTLTVEE